LYHTLAAEQVGILHKPATLPTACKSQEYCRRLACHHFWWCQWQLIEPVRVIEYPMHERGGKHGCYESPKLVTLRAASHCCSSSNNSSKSNRKINA